VAAYDALETEFVIGGERQSRGPMNQNTPKPPTADFTHRNFHCITNKLTLQNVIGYLFFLNFENFAKKLTVCSLRNNIIFFLFFCLPCSDNILAVFLQFKNSD